MSIAIAFNALLKERGMTKSFAAARMGTSRQLMMSGVNGNPTLKTLELVASAFDMSASELLALNEWLIAIKKNKR